MTEQIRSLPSVKSIKNPKEREISVELRDSASALKDALEIMEAAEATYTLALRRFEIAHEYLDNLVTKYTREGRLETITDWMLRFYDLRRYAYTALSLGDALGDRLDGLGRERR